MVIIERNKKVLGKVKNYVGRRRDSYFFPGKEHLLVPVKKGESKTLTRGEKDT